MSERAMLGKIVAPIGGSPYICWRVVGFERTRIRNGSIEDCAILRPEAWSPDVTPGEQIIYPLEKLRVLADVEVLAIVSQ